MDLKLNGYSIKHVINKTWILIFRHNSIKGGFFNNGNEANFSLKKSKFSLFNKVNQLFKVTDDNSYYFYEFILEYPELEGYNHWRQELFPSDERTRTESVNYARLTQISWPHSWFGGLALNEIDKGCSFIDGSPLLGTWHFAIGSYASYHKANTFPGPCLIQNVCNNSVSDVKLWMRFDNPNLIQYFPKIISTCRVQRTKVLSLSLFMVHLLFS